MNRTPWSETPLTWTWRIAQVLSDQPQGCIDLAQIVGCSEEQARMAIQHGMREGWASRSSRGRYVRGSGEPVHRRAQGSLPQTVRDILGQATAPVSFADIKHRLGVSAESAHVTLGRMVERGEVTRLIRGLYCLTTSVDAFAALIPSRTASRSDEPSAALIPSRTASRSDEPSAAHRILAYMATISSPVLALELVVQTNLPENRIHRALSRLVTAGKIERVRPGMYRMASAQGVTGG